jgi:hypothetical protein
VARGAAVRALARGGAAGRVARAAGAAAGSMVLPCGVDRATGAVRGRVSGAGAATLGGTGTVTSGGSASSTRVRVMRVGQPAETVTLTTGSSIATVLTMRTTASLASRPCVTRARTVPGGSRDSPD